MRAPRAGSRDLIDRRRFLSYGLIGTAAVAGFPFAPRAASPAAPGPSALDSRIVEKLDSSSFVYISPLKSNGSESQCHAELWYAWMSDPAGSPASSGSLVVTVATDGWKAQSLARGLDRARLWVGDYGRWKGFFSNNENFRAGPSFVARAEIVDDVAVLDRLLAVYETKYPAEIATWRDRMRAGSRDGTRVVIRYTPALPTKR